MSRTTLILFAIAGSSLFLCTTAGLVIVFVMVLSQFDSCKLCQKIVRYKLPLKHPIAFAMFTALVSAIICILFAVFSAIYDLLFGEPNSGTNSVMTESLCNALSSTGAIFIPIALFGLYSFLIQRVYAVVPNRKVPPSAVWLGRMRYLFLLIIVPTAVLTTGQIVPLDLGVEGDPNVYMTCVLNAHPVIVGIFAVLDFSMATAYFIKFYTLVKVISPEELTKSLTAVENRRLEDVAKRNLITSITLIVLSLGIDCMALLMKFFAEQLLMAWFIGAAPMFLLMGMAMIMSNPSAWEVMGTTSHIEQQEEQAASPRASTRRTAAKLKASRTNSMMIEASKSGVAN
jgi:hypothetical protein